MTTCMHDRSFLVWTTLSPENRIPFSAQTWVLALLKAREMVIDHSTCRSSCPHTLHIPAESNFCHSTSCTPSCKDFQRPTTFTHHSIRSESTSHIASSRSDHTTWDSSTWFHQACTTVGQHCCQSSCRSDQVKAGEGHSFSQIQMYSYDIVVREYISLWVLRVCLYWKLIGRRVMDRLTTELCIDGLDISRRWPQKWMWTGTMLSIMFYPKIFLRHHRGNHAGGVWRTSTVQYRRRCLPWSDRMGNIDASV